jgi:hypothetical protein
MSGRAAALEEQSINFVRPTIRRTNMATASLNHHKTAEDSSTAMRGGGDLALATADAFWPESTLAVGFPVAQQLARPCPLFSSPRLLAAMTAKCDYYTAQLPLHRLVPPPALFHRRARRAAATPHHDLLHGAATHFPTATRIAPLCRPIIKKAIGVSFASSTRTAR